MIHPAVMPKKYKVSRSQLNLGHNNKAIHMFGHISPPKGTTELNGMGDSLMIVCIPYKRHPWNLLFVIKLVQMFHQQSLILQTQIQDAQPPIILGSTNQLPGSQRFTRVLTTFPAQTLPLNPFQLFDYPHGNLQGTEEINGQRRNHRIQ